MEITRRRMIGALGITGLGLLASRIATLQLPKQDRLFGIAESIAHTEKVFGAQELPFDLAKAHVDASLELFTAEFGQELLGKDFANRFILLRHAPSTVEDLQEIHADYPHLEFTQEIVSSIAGSSESRFFGWIAKESGGYLFIKLPEVNEVKPYNLAYATYERITQCREPSPLIFLRSIVYHEGIHELVALNAPRRLLSEPFEKIFRDY